MRRLLSIKSFSRFLILLLIVQLSIGLFAFPVNQAKASGTIYYVDNSCANNGNGTAQTCASSPGGAGPFNSIANAQSAVTGNQSGNSLLLKGGETFREQYTVPAYGTSGSPFTIGAYGTGAAPIISGANLISSSTWTATSSSPANYSWVSEASGFNPNSATSTYTITNASSTTVASGTVSQANMRLSTIAGDAFVDFSAANTLTPYVGDLLTIKDSSGNQLTGYIKAAGTGQTYGSQLLSNTTFATTSGLSAWSGSMTPVTGASCHSSTCLQITKGNIVNPFSAAAGMLILSSVYGNVGTAAFCAIQDAEDGGAYENFNSQYFTGSWTQYSGYFTSDVVGSGYGWVQEYQNGSATGVLSYVDTASATQVLTPSTTGVTIVSALASSVYYASYSGTAPNQVFEDGSRLAQNTTSSASLTAGQWYLDTSNTTIWVYLIAGDNPSAHTMETSQRNEAIYLNGLSYVTVSNVDLEEASFADLYATTGSNIVVSGVTAQRTYGAGINLQSISNGTIDSCRSAYNGGIGILAGSGVPGLLIDECVVYNNDQIIGTYGGIYVGTDVSVPSTNVLVRRCAVYSNNGGGIQLDTIGTGALVEYNFISGNQAYGIDLENDNDETADYNIVINNDVTLAGIGGIFVHADGASATTMTGNQVNGNTVSGNYGAGLIVSGPSSPAGPSACTNNVAENNLVVNTIDGPNFYANQGCDNDGTYGSSNDYNYDGFGAAVSDFIEWGSGIYYSTYAAWEAAPGNCGTVGCSHSVETDPLFVSTSTDNFALQSSSPAIDAGLNLGSTYEWGLDPASTWPSNIILDNQNSNGKGWEIGAYVYPNQAILSITTSTSLSFPASYGGTATSSQPVVVTNTGPASSTLNWSATSTNPWLTFSPASSSLAGGASTTVLFIVNPAGMAVGATSTTATISDPNASSSPQTLPVTLTINATTSTPPRSLTATPGNTQAALSWIAPSSTGGSAVTGYIINDKLAASSTYALATTTGASATSTVIAGLTNGQLYDFEALAQNGVGTSTPSNVATATPVSNDATLSNLTISTGTLSPAFSSGITSYTDSVANSVTSVTVTPTANQASSTITVNSSTVVSGSASNPIALNVGSNTVLTVVTAQNGVAQDTYTITVTRTNTPSVVMTAPTSTTISGIVTVSASSSAVSPATIASVQFYLDGSPLGSPITSTSSPNTYSYSWNTASSTNGSHTLYALATDNYSNTATSTSITLTVQNQAFLSITTSTSLAFSAAHGSTSTAPQSIVITNAGTASSTLHWSATSTQPWLTFSKSSSSIAGGASTSVAFIVNPTGMALGTWNATATIADPNASSSPQTLPVSLVITATGVAVSLTSPANGATVTSTISVTANPTSTAGIASLQFLLDGAPLGPLLTSAPYTTPWNTALSSNGSHILTASTTDADSNVATSSPVTVTVQNQAFLSVTTSTSLSFTAAHGSTAPQSQSVVIANTGTASSTLNWSASSTQAWLTFSPASSSVAGGNNATISFIANPTNLAIGTYNATATLADPNASSSPQSLPVTLTVNATGISTSMTSPANGATVSSIVPFTATATSTAGIASVQFYLDGSPLGPAVTTSPYTVSWDTAMGTNGSHTLYALATDNDANTASSSLITVTVDNTPTAIVSVGNGYGYGVPNYGMAPAPTPSTTPAASTPSSSGTTSLSLADQLKALQAQLAALQAQANTPVSSTTPYVFTRNLGLWDRGADVRALQEFLISQASGPAAGKLKAHGASQVFGFLTYNALIELQEKAGIRPASGYFGPRTRAWVNAHD